MSDITEYYFNGIKQDFKVDHCYFDYFNLYLIVTPDINECYWADKCEKETIITNGKSIKKINYHIVDNSLTRKMTKIYEYEFERALGVPIKFYPNQKINENDLKTIGLSIPSIPNRYFYVNRIKKTGPKFKYYERGVE